MESIVVEETELKGELKSEISKWLKSKAPNQIAFPYKGKHVRGFIFRWNQVSYYIIQSVVTKTKI